MSIDDHGSKKTPEGFSVVVTEELRDGDTIQTTREYADDGTVVLKIEATIIRCAGDLGLILSVPDTQGAMLSLLNAIANIDQRTSTGATEGGDAWRTKRASLKRLRKVARTRLKRFIREFGVGRRLIETETSVQREILRDVLARHDPSTDQESKSGIMEEWKWIDDYVSIREAAVREEMLRPLVVTTVGVGFHHLYHETRTAFVLGLFTLVAAGARSVAEILVEMLGRVHGSASIVPKNSCGPTLKERIKALKVPEEIKDSLTGLAESGNRALHGGSSFDQKDAYETLLLLHKAIDDSYALGGRPLM
jgi:hypothetical protein